MSSLFDQGLFDNHGGLGLGPVSMAIMFKQSSGKSSIYGFCFGQSEEDINIRETQFRFF